MAHVSRFMTRGVAPIDRHATQHVLLLRRPVIYHVSQTSASRTINTSFYTPTYASLQQRPWSTTSSSCRTWLRGSRNANRVAVHQRAFSRYAEARASSEKTSPSNTPATSRPRRDAAQATDGSAAKPVPQILKRLAPPVLHENIYTLPNFLTTTRIITAPVISYALLHSQPVLAFSLFAYSSITDLVDGYLARRYHSGTVLGSILDPFADKLLMTLTTISLYSIGTFPWWLTLIILGRDAGLLLSALYFRWISLPPPRTMKRYWDFSLPSAEVRPTEISKINTLLQFLLVADAVLLPVLPVSLVETWNLWGVFEGWMGLVAGTTVWSGLSYVFSNDAIRFIGQDQKSRQDEKENRTGGHK